MTETPDTPSSSVPSIQDNSFADVLKTLLNKTVTMVNPESYEDAPIGHQIRAGFYRAKLIGMGKDYLVVVAEYVFADKEGRKEPVKQYIPIDKIKRISLMKKERLIHI